MNSVAGAFMGLIQFFKRIGTRLDFLKTGSIKENFKKNYSIEKKNISFNEHNIITYIVLFDYKINSQNFIYFLNKLF